MFEIPDISEASNVDISYDLGICVRIVAQRNVSYG